VKKWGVASNVAQIAQFDKGIGEDMVCSFQGGQKLLKFHKGMGKIYGMFGVKGFNVW
jgi:hypothetical protein